MIKIMKKKYLEPVMEAVNLSLGARLLVGSLDLQKQTVTWDWNEEDVEK